MDRVKESPLKNRLKRLENDKQKLKERLAALKKKNLGLEKELRVSSRLLNDVPGCVVLIQQEKVVFVNENTVKLSGYPIENILNRSFLEFIHPDNIEQIRIFHQKRISGKMAPDVFETYLVTKGGETLCCEVRVKKIRYHGRRAFLVHLIDQGKRKKRERRLIQSEKMEALNRMAEGVSRQYGNCLNIMNESYNLSETLPSGSLKRIRAAIQMGNLIVHRLERLASAGEQIPVAVLFDLRDVVKDAVETTRPLWEQNRGNKGHTVRFETYLRSKLQVKGDPREIKDALVNIILNAVDALPADGEIHLSAEESSGFANIYIQDNGVGIQDHIKDKIFDPFFTTKGNSMPGLGLTMASAILARHEGEIELIDREGRGATFVVKLPIARDKSPSRTKGRKRGLRDSHIMVIGDEDIARDLLVQLLLSKGARVAAVSTVNESLKLLSKENFDLILLDQDESGLESQKIIPKIRKADETLPVILIKGPDIHKKREDTDTLRSIDPDFVIGMPLDMDRILPLISKALEIRAT